MLISIRSLSPLAVLAGLSLSGCLPPVENATKPSPPEAKVEDQKVAAAATAGTVPEGYTTTASGLNYKIVRAGSDRKPTAADTVLCHYRGTLTNGTEFDSSYSRNEPTQFPLSGVIAGWTEGLQLIGEGGEIELLIPGNLAYGARGMPPTIPPNATLHFKVELLKVR